jgi:general secretion pathway protein G
MVNIIRKKRGFTLVELLIVIIIIAVLAAVAIPKFANSSQKSKESALRAELSLLRNAVELFKNDTGCYPASLSDLAATTAPATGKDKDGSDYTITASNYKGPYISRVNPDPVSGAAFTYSTTAGSVGNISSSATGNDSNGNPYSGY